jgi:predicted Na+-dependent transporter
MYIKRFHDWALIELFQDLFGVLHLLSLSLYEVLWGDNIVGQIIKDFFYKWAEMLLHLFKLGRKLFISIIIALSCSNHNQLIRQI